VVSLKHQTTDRVQCMSAKGRRKSAGDSVRHTARDIIVIDVIQSLDYAL